MKILLRIHALVSRVFSLSQFEECANGSSEPILLSPIVNNLTPFLERVPIDKPSLFRLI